jgi:hypothetical protein
VTPAEAQQIIDILAGGIDPETGEMLPPDSCLNSPNTIRALFLASKALAAAVRKAEADGDRPGKAGKAWSQAEDEQLLKAFDAGTTVQDLASLHERSTGGITSRLVRLGRITERAQAHAHGA